MMFRTDPTVDRIAELTILGGLGGRERRMRAPQFETISLRAGQTLITQGVRNRFVYFVVEGALAVHADGERIATVGPDSLVGERTAYDRRAVANATVTAATPSTVLGIDHRAFLDIVGTHPSIDSLVRKLHESRAA